MLNDAAQHSSTMTQVNIARRRRQRRSTLLDNDDAARHYSTMQLDTTRRRRRHGLTLLDDDDDVARHCLMMLTTLLDDDDDVAQHYSLESIYVNIMEMLEVRPSLNLASTPCWKVWAQLSWQITVYGGHMAISKWCSIYIISLNVVSIPYHISVYK